MAVQSDAEFEALCNAIGLMTLTWAWAETNLARTIGVMNYYAGPIKGHPEAPLSLTKRVSCLKTALRDIPVLKFLQQDGAVLAKRFLELGARRNHFLHGATWQVPEGGFEAFSVGVKRGNYTVQNHRFDKADAVGLNFEIAKLQDDAAAFFLRVARVFA